MVKIIFYLIMLISIFLIFKDMVDLRSKVKIDKKIKELELKEIGITINEENKFIRKFLEKNKGKFSYTNIDKKLKSNGYPFGLNATKYILTKVFIGVALLAANLINGDILLGIILGIVGYFIIDLFMYVQKKEDEKKISMDMLNVYETLVIQIEADIPVTQILKELYLIVKSDRVKKPLKLLAVKLVTIRDTDRALNEFGEYFNGNVDIQNFIMSTKQVLITGQAKEVFADLLKNIREANKVHEEQIPKRVQNKVLQVQMLMYVGILCIIVYLLATQVLNMSKTMF